MAKRLTKADVKRDAGCQGAYQNPHDFIQVAENEQTLSNGERRRSVRLFCSKCGDLKILQ